MRRLVLGLGICVIHTSVIVGINPLVIGGAGVVISWISSRISSSSSSMMVMIMRMPIIRGCSLCCSCRSGDGARAGSRVGGVRRTNFLSRIHRHLLSIKFQRQS